MQSPLWMDDKWETSVHNKVNYFIQSNSKYNKNFYEMQSLCALM